MPVSFKRPNNAGSGYLIPAPMVSVARSFVRSEDGIIQYPEYIFTLTGKIVNIGGAVDSPGTSAGTFADMNDIVAEQKRIRDLFSQDGGLLEIIPPTGTNAIKAYCTIDNVSFSENTTWTNFCDYTITLKSNNIVGSTAPSGKLASANETWDINEEQNGVYAISHQIRAEGALIYDANGVQNTLSDARQYVRSRSYYLSTVGGLTQTITGSGTFDDIQFLLQVAGTTNFWNMAKSEGVGYTSNSWQLTESFIYAPSGAYREEFGATTNQEGENQKKITININGSVYGFANLASNLGTRMANATSGYNKIQPSIYTRAVGYTPNGFTLNPVPTTKQVSYEGPEGSIKYNYTYTAVSGNLIPNATDESINVSDVGTTDIFAQIQVPGRTAGPVVQNMNTTTLPERTVSINAVIPPSNPSDSILNLYRSKPNTNSIIDALKPENGRYYVKQNSEEWSPLRGQYSRVISWTLAPTGSVTGIPSGVHSV